MRPGAGCDPSTSHVRASDARTDAAGAAHHGAAGAEHQQGLQAAGELCPVLAVNLGGKMGASVVGASVEPAAGAARGALRAGAQPQVGGRALPCWSGLAAGGAAA